METANLRQENKLRDIDRFKGEMTSKTPATYLYVTYSDICKPWNNDE